MKTSKPWTSQPIKHVTAGLLAGTLLFSLSGCRKSQQKKDAYNKSENYVSGKEILESDPYFNSDIYPLKFPLKEGKTVEMYYVDRCEYEDGVVVASIQVDYEPPEDADFGQLMECHDHSTVLFDEKGNYIREIETKGVDLYDIASDIDGNICILSSNNVGTTGTMGILLTIVDPQGNTLRDMQLEDPPALGDGSTSATMGVLPDGRYTVCGLGKLVIYDRSGKKTAEISDLGRIIDGSVIRQNGKDYVLSGVYSTYGDGDLQIKEVDLETGKLGEGIDANIISSLGTPVATKEGLFVRSSNGCFRYDIESGELEKVFDWNDADVPRNYVSRSTMYPQSEDELVVVGIRYTNIGTDASVIHLSRAKQNPHAGKRIIVVGGIDMAYDEELLDFLDAYNSDTSSKSRAVLVDYHDGVDPEADPAEMYNAIYLDFLSGSGPDILYGFSENSTFNNSEIMLDLNTFIDGPNGLSRDDYFDNIFRSCEKNGKLFHIPLRFTLFGMQVNTKYIHNRDGWTYDEFEEASQSLPEQVSFIEASEYSTFLMKLLMCNHNFVNYDLRTVDFQNDEMKRILQLARTFGVKELPKDEGWEETYIGNGIYIVGEDLTRTKFESELLAVTDVYVGDVRSYVDARDDLPGSTAFLGYPSPDGAGMTCTSYESLGIVATSKYADLAWDFIRSFLQYSGSSDTALPGFPINKDVFEKESLMEMERENKQYERMARETVFDASALDFALRITQEDIDEVRELLLSVNRSGFTDISISSIICEEAAGYFAGDRTEDEVLKTIQNRASLVVKEL
ncbi:MAG: extracellular solute-binding protein [Clostridiales bacterium]|nr:extracellular solute-binding protein [Clostridiales bacterium]